MCCRPPPGGQAAKLPKFSGGTPLGPYPDNGWGVRGVDHLALALEGTAVRVLFDLSPMEQRDLQGPDQGTREAVLAADLHGAFPTEGAVWFGSPQSGSEGAG